MLKLLSILLLLTSTSTPIPYSDAALDTFKDCELYQQQTNASNLFFLIRKYVGTPIPSEIFLTDWEDAVIVSQKTERFEVKAKYAVGLDKILVLFNDRIYTLNKEPVREIMFKDKVFAVEGIQQDDGIDLHFFEVLSAGQVALLKKYEQKVILKNNGNYKTGIRKTALYVKSSNGQKQVSELSFSRSDILKLMDDKKATIKTYLDKKAQWSTEESLIELFNFYNAL